MTGSTVVPDSVNEMLAILLCVDINNFQFQLDMLSPGMGATCQGEWLISPMTSVAVLFSSKGHRNMVSPVHTY